MNSEAWVPIKLSWLDRIVQAETAKTRVKNSWVYVRLTTRDGISKTGISLNSLRQAKSEARAQIREHRKRNQETK